jgi:murein DD-endopeptidase MepM/ murein hydrolase activator NlpD
MPRAGAALLVALVAAAVSTSSASAAGDPAVAALQVALRVKHLYPGQVDGVEGPLTDRAIRRFQRRRGLRVDGIAGQRTRTALGKQWRHRLGSRPLQEGNRGWDVAALQFRLSWHGFPGGTFDGVFGPRTERAVRGFQQWAGLGVDGVVGNATLARLARPRASAPPSLLRPLDAAVTSPFGPRASRFHAGVDMAASIGAPVRAAAAGQVSFAGWNDGFGRLVTVTHSHGLSTFYAHLSRIGVRPGQRVAAGARIGRVGRSGVRVSGPHLHFEVHVRGAAVDPLPALRR